MTIDAIEPDFEPPREAVRSFDAHVRAPMRSNEGASPNMPVDRPFEGAPAFSQALYETLRHAEAVGARSLCWCDADFGAWPLGETEWVEILTRWARGGAGRELVIVASGYAL